MLRKTPVSVKWRVCNSGWNTINEGGRENRRKLINADMFLDASFQEMRKKDHLKDSEREKGLK